MPLWKWECHDKIGKRAAGWVENGSLVTEEDCRNKLMIIFHALDFSRFKAVQTDHVGIYYPVPAAWYEFGTTRQHMEEDAGLRERSIYLRPPIEEKPIVLSSLIGRPAKSRPAWIR